MTATRRPDFGVVCALGIGPTRGGRAQNEDNFLVAIGGALHWRDGEQSASGERPAHDGCVFAVADGMGGHDDGEIASYSAVQALARYAAEPPDAMHPAELREFMLDAHGRLRARASRDGVVRMGTTFDIVWVEAGRATWAHVGDSRIYLYRNGQLSALTRDHTRAEFAERDGRPTPSHPHNLAQNFIYGSRGLGQDTSVRIDAGVDTGSFEPATGDRLVLTTDGVHGAVSLEAMQHILAEFPAPQACAEALVAAGMRAGSDDNLTALVVEFA
jgi:protein phosphatase